MSIIKAGSLKYTAEAIVQKDSKSAISGASRKVNEVVGTFRFFRQTMKEQMALIGKEEGKRGTMFIQCRIGPTTEAMTHYRYGTQLYRIEQKLPDELHHSYDITATLVNE